MKHLSSQRENETRAFHNLVAATDCVFINSISFNRPSGEATAALDGAPSIVGTGCSREFNPRVAYNSWSEREWYRANSARSLARSRGYLEILNIDIRGARAAAARKWRRHTCTTIRGSNKRCSGGRSGADRGIYPPFCIPTGRSRRRFSPTYTRAPEKVYLSLSLSLLRLYPWYRHRGEFEAFPLCRHNGRQPPQLSAETNF